MESDISDGDRPPGEDARDCGSWNIGALSVRRLVFLLTLVDDKNGGVVSHHWVPIYTNLAGMTSGMSGILH